MLLVLICDQILLVDLLLFFHQKFSVQTIRHASDAHIHLIGETLTLASPRVLIVLRIVLDSLGYSRQIWFLVGMLR